MLIVDTDVVCVERQLRAGELACPPCGAPLAPWGHGRPREVRGDLGARFFVRPRRSRCSGCQVTHVLLPEMLWPRRSDAAEVIGAGLEIAALGMGRRQVAAHLGLADGTVRGWIRRFRRRSEDVRRYFTVALVVLADDPVMPEPTQTLPWDAVSVVAGAQRGAAAQWPPVDTGAGWGVAGRAIVGRGGARTPSPSWS
ncbi:DUF6431 domain-containing protein, partial [Streptomyces sp. NPDC019443]|uniref:DUF6431 domain-containing protein n=1 Tax=Streptomyces sp. NPDC019443 TaxID=3365061 RepID=UPI00379E4534